MRFFFVSSSLCPCVPIFVRASPRSFVAFTLPLVLLYGFTRLYPVVVSLPLCSVSLCIFCLSVHHRPLTSSSLLHPSVSSAFHSSFCIILYPLLHFVILFPPFPHLLFSFP
ncbi:hypothetical protein SCHPADRAFT_668705 [Schizopora paradoxa]|uniref:Uncharacterized protein n=1 Tax=Schizopora paradoxa TaxID=27342 RepID=A0A0H2RQE4_9AGAM|nr:hypothetical protein SCHPADRAFT_668705 [Schizopora paradoxa]